MPLIEHPMGTKKTIVVLGVVAVVAAVVVYLLPVKSSNISTDHPGQNATSTPSSGIVVSKPIPADLSGELLKAPTLFDGAIDLRDFYYPQIIEQGGKREYIDPIDNFKFQYSFRGAEVKFLRWVPGGKSEESPDLSGQMETGQIGQLDPLNQGRQFGSDGVFVFHIFELSIFHNASDEKLAALKSEVELRMVSKFTKKIKLHGVEGLATADLSAVIFTHKAKTVIASIDNPINEMSNDAQYNGRQDVIDRFAPYFYTVLNSFQFTD